MEQPEGFIMEGKEDYVCRLEQHALAVISFKFSHQQH
jgi:hypothetical protein